MKDSIVEASIHDLVEALQTGATTSVDLVAQYLHRISKYDCRGPSLNSIPLINQEVFEEAAASDDRRCIGAPHGSLDGIPYTVKDSYKVKGMTVASGSPAFENLRSNDDAFTVAKLREAGAVLIGKTNMCPMAYGGMQRGLYGRAESPYNRDCLAAAFASGSSNGSGAATGASLAAFGMGEETVSSGRSPASNNGLIAYTPSRGLISIRGNWPLYPTCDVVVPHTRSMADLFQLLDVLTIEDNVTKGDFWRDQPFVKIPNCWSNKPTTFASVATHSSLKGVRVAVPEMYIGGKQLEEGLPVYTSPAVQALWERARKDLESAGATVIQVPDFPVVRVYENPNSESSSQASSPDRLPANWNSTERGTLIAHAWEDFLRANQDPNFPSLVDVDYTKIFPAVAPDHPQIKYSEPSNAIRWSKLSSHLTNSHGEKANTTFPYDIANLEAAVKALESMRKSLFEEWMDQNDIDLVVFPAAGDVGRADADVNHDSAQHAWSNGVKYSNGNRVFRHLGIPSVTVPMGLIEDKRMPMGLTFLGKAYDDVRILQWAYAYEQISARRTAPTLTPSLKTDAIVAQAQQPGAKTDSSRPTLQISKCAGVVQSTDTACITLQGVITFSLPAHSTVSPIVDVYIDGDLVDSATMTVEEREQTGSKEDGNQTTCFSFTCRATTGLPPIQDERNRVAAKIARDSTMIVVLARGVVHAERNGTTNGVHGSSSNNGRKRDDATKPSGWIGLIHQTELENAHLTGAHRQ